MTLKNGKNYWKERKKMSVAFMQNMELILTVGVSFVLGIVYGVWLANEIREEVKQNADI